MGKAKVTASEVRSWALERGLDVGSRGHIRQDIVEAFNRAHRVKEYVNTNPFLKTRDDETVAV